MVQKEKKKKPLKLNTVFTFIMKVDYLKKTTEFIWGIGACFFGGGVGEGLVYLALETTWDSVIKYQERGQKCAKSLFWLGIVW